jgi:phosphoglycolate phosphatase-like HAD superfamily hydrolase
MQPTVLLFDIDGTLIDTGGAGRRAIERAFGEVHEKPAACDAIRFSGMTDRAIVRAGLGAISAETSDEAIEEVIAAYVAYLREEVAASPRYRVLDGVRALVTRCLEIPDFAVGLGTGNVRAGAHVKLERSNLWDLFAFGGFGCDAEDRAALLATGARRGAASLKTPIDRCRIVVIGDTPRDILAARSIGAACIAVATGTYDAKALWEHAPDAVLASLESEDALEVLGCAQ